MSTDQLLGAVLRQAPQSDPEAVLDLLVACDGNIDQVLKLMGVKPASRQKQMTLGKIVKAPRNKTVPTPKSSGIEHLFTVSQVENAPIMCSLVENVLDPSLANALLWQLLDESKGWEKQEFYLFDRKVESPHTSASYTCNEEILAKQNSTYQGRKVVSRPFTPEMHEARKAVEKIIAARYPGLGWYCDLIIANRYDGKNSGVGYHSDQLTHLGPRPIIVGLSLGCNREFRLKERSAKKSPHQFSVHTMHNSAVIMKPGCQEAWKHCIPQVSAVDSHVIAGDTRISLTFRMYPPGYSLEQLPKCKCGTAMVLRTTSSVPYKYIWQCAEGYISNNSCGETIYANI